MCGIAGYISKELKEEQLLNMCDRISHRGPDSHGVFHEGNVGLGHRRLSIIDLSDAGSQPMYSEDGNYVIVFNGEIYNYQEIKFKLAARGCRFKSNSDSEVVLQSFIVNGVDAVNDFIGMFAFAVFNRQSKELFLFRDRVGVKPVYYYREEKELWFASELKSLTAVLSDKTIDADAMHDFFRFGYIRGNKTIFKKVSKLPAGNYLHVNPSGDISINKYWSVRDKISSVKLDDETRAVSQLEDLMRSSFNYRMVADVPVGVFLSGGIDSSALTAVLAKERRDLKTFSIGFDHNKYNEAPYAKKIASYLGTDHHEAILTSSDAEKVMDTYFSIYDEPFADSSGIPVFLISEFAKQNGCKVVLSADGGDELFGGYGRYSSLPVFYNKISGKNFLLNLLAPAFRSAGKIAGNFKNLEHRTAKVNDLIKSSSKGFSSDFYKNYLSISPESLLEDLIVPEFGKEKNEFSSELKMDPAELMMLWDFENYLPDDLLVKVDRASMATSIEAREPFLDHRLIEFAFNLSPGLRIKNGDHKYLLKQVLYKYIPQSYFDRPKMGFSIPLFKWFSQKLDKEFETLFTKENLSSIPVLNSEAVIGQYNKYLHFKASGKEDNILMMWHLFVFIRWWQKWMN